MYARSTTEMKPIPLRHLVFDLVTTCFGGTYGIFYYLVVTEREMARPWDEWLMYACSASLVLTLVWGIFFVRAEPGRTRFALALILTAFGLFVLACLRSTIR